MTATDTDAIAAGIVARSEVSPEEADLWQARPVLAHLHTFARACRTSPWAVLGAAMVRAVVDVPPRVQLPGLIGGPASLNLFTALVGAPGSGKGAADAAAKGAFTLYGWPFTATLGSGEGIAHMFARRVKGTDANGDVEIHRRRALIVTPEVDNLSQLLSRSGSTLSATLRSAWSGEPLGHFNADAARTIPVPGHAYRLGLVLGVQPAQAGPLLNGATGGMPQRFLWLPATDPLTPDVRPGEPDPMPWPVMHWPEVGSTCLLTVPEVAAQAVDAAHLARNRGEVDALDGHALLLRLKVAAALAFLDGQPRPGVEHWDLAGVVMAVSDRTREAMAATVAEQYRQANRARGHAEGERAGIVEDAAHGRAVARVAQNIRLKLNEAGTSVARGDVRKWLNSRDRRDFFDDAVAHLLDGQLIAVTEVDGGQRLSLPEGSL